MFDMITSILQAGAAIGANNIALNACKAFTPRNVSGFGKVCYSLGAFGLSGAAMRTASKEVKETMNQLKGWLNKKTETVQEEETVEEVS